MSDENLPERLRSWSLIMSVPTHASPGLPELAPLLADAADRIADLEAQIIWERRAAAVQVNQLTADAERVRLIIRDAGVSDHEGGNGDTYYERPTWHMAEELVALVSSLEAEVAEAWATAMEHAQTIERLVAQRTEARAERRRPTAIDLFAEERRRVIEQEGFVSDHLYEHGELLAAAACYIQKAIDPSSARAGGWPWADRWWKPSPDDPVKMLVKAGQLIAAEVDRVLEDEVNRG
jgi:hypothetical protein